MIFMCVLIRAPKSQVPSLALSNFSGFPVCLWEVTDIDSSNEMKLLEKALSLGRSGFAVFSLLSV